MKHIWALHYIYIPRLNRDLAMFCQQWNNHPLRTEHHQSPLQLFVKSALQLRNSNLTAIQDLFDADYTPSPASNSIASTTVQPALAAGPQSPLDGEDQVHVPAVMCPISDVQLAAVQQQINPLDDSKGPLGLELYLSLLDFLSQLGLGVAQV